MQIAWFSTWKCLAFSKKMPHQSSLCYRFSSKTPAKAELLIYQHSIVLSLPGWYQAVPVVTFQQEIQEDSNPEWKLNLLIIPNNNKNNKPPSCSESSFHLVQFTPLTKFVWDIFRLICWNSSSKPCLSGPGMHSLQYIYGINPVYILSMS